MDLLGQSLHPSGEPGQRGSSGLFRIVESAQVNGGDGASVDQNSGAELVSSARDRPSTSAAKIKQHQDYAERAWQDSGLVFTTRLGTPVEPRDFHSEAASAATQTAFKCLGQHLDT